MGTFNKRDILKMSKKEEFVRSVKKFSDKELRHLFTLSEDEISNVLTTLSCYCEHLGAKATKRVHEDNLLQMIQYEDGTCGHRFLLWAM